MCTHGHTCKRQQTLYVNLSQWRLWLSITNEKAAAPHVSKRGRTHHDAATSHYTCSEERSSYHKPTCWVKTAGIWCVIVSGKFIHHTLDPVGWIHQGHWLGKCPDGLHQGNSPHILQTHIACQYSLVEAFPAAHRKRHMTAFQRWGAAVGRRNVWLQVCFG